MLCLRDWKWIFLAGEKHEGVTWCGRARLSASTVHGDREVME